MDLQEFEKDYYNYLQERGDSVRAEKERAYLYLDLQFAGITTGERTEFVKKYEKELRSLSKADALSAVDHFWNMQSYDMKCIALHILNMYSDYLDSTDMPLIDKLIRESKGWAFLDGLVIPIMPKLLSKDPSLYSVLKEWIKVDDYWVRRSAILAQLLFFRADNGGDRELFFSFARSQFDEEWINRIYSSTEDKKRARFFIRKAIGWTLREMSVKQPKIVCDFLIKNKDKMSGLTYREGMKRLPDDLKNKLLDL